MKLKLIICVVGLALIQTLSAQESADTLYSVEGILKNGSNTAPLMKTFNPQKVAVGDKGELSKFFETKIFGATATGWLQIAEIEVTRIEGNLIYTKVLEEQSEITVNGEKKDHFVEGKVVKFTAHKK
ncbi:MAG: hypothetical protein MRY83_07055 [Flavobacteriales bacterium]|nr:hypothetical protein [Flavobacteriales bacterium]